MAKVDIYNPEKKYNIIYADPPWNFVSWSSKSHKHVSKHYPTMTIEEIMRLPVATIYHVLPIVLWPTVLRLPVQSVFLV